jgi:type VI secretion system protein ImpA
LTDPAAFTTPLTDANPSGPNLEYDVDFLALERARQGRPEQVMGDSVNPAEEPDWPQVRERAEALLGRTRDLRVALTLTTALLQIEGLAGLAAGLSIIKGLLEGQWDTVHPQVDADDANDPTLRVNSLVGLASADGLLKALRETPLVHSKLLGRISLRDIRIASGKLAAPAGLADPPKQVKIDAVFLDADLKDLQAAAAAVATAVDGAAAIDRVLVDKVGARAPELKPLILDLTDIKRVLTDKLAARGGISLPVEDGTSAAATNGVGLTPGAAGVGSREEVVRQLDRLCEYYERCEPSSPVPLLLQRAKRLVSKDFLEIIRDLTPEGLAQAESIGGVVKKSD